MRLLLEENTVLAFMIESRVLQHHLLFTSMLFADGTMAETRHWTVDDYFWNQAIRNWRGENLDDVINMLLKLFCFTPITTSS